MRTHEKKEWCTYFSFAVFQFCWRIANRQKKRKRRTRAERCCNAAILQWLAVDSTHNTKKRSAVKNELELEKGSETERGNEMLKWLEMEWLTNCA